MYIEVAFSDDDKKPYGCYLDIGSDEFCKLHYIIKHIEKAMDYYVENFTITESLLSTVFLTEDKWEAESIAKKAHYYEKRYDNRMSKLVPQFTREKAFGVDWNIVNDIEPVEALNDSYAYPNGWGLNYFAGALADYYNILFGSRISRGTAYSMREVEHMILEDPNRAVKKLCKIFEEDGILEGLLEVLAHFYYAAR